MILAELCRFLCYAYIWFSIDAFLRRSVSFYGVCETWSNSVRKALDLVTDCNMSVREANRNLSLVVCVDFFLDVKLSISYIMFKFCLSFLF